MKGAALVTGASRRIGRELALALGGAGHAVAVHHRRDAEAAEEVAQLLRARGVEAAAMAADLQDAAAPRALVSDAIRRLGPLTVLVNSASTFQDDRVGDLDPLVFDRQMAVNLRAPILLAQAFADQAFPRSADPCVVNILDQRVLKLNPQFFSYTLAKAGLWTATRTLAQALAPRVRVNGIGPGPTLMSTHQTETDFARESAATPLERGSRPDEIAAALLYLVGARAVTGQMIAVDGGQHLAWRTPDVLGEG